MQKPVQKDGFCVCRGRESDPRPSDYEPLALPLSYLGMILLTERGKYYYRAGLLSTPQRKKFR